MKEGLPKFWQFLFLYATFWQKRASMYQKGEPAKQNRGAQDSSKLKSRYRKDR